MKTLGAAELSHILQAISQRIISERDYLCELDGLIGDADHGIAMADGFAAISDALQTLDTSTATLTDVFNTSAKSFLNAVGASSGPLYATALMRAGKYLKGETGLALEDSPQLFIWLAEGIQARGKAEAGEKTMLDSWLPAAEAASQHGGDIVATLNAVKAAAQTGAESTKAMLAGKGRAARLGERSVGHIDPGAASAAIMIEVWVDELLRFAE